MAEGEGELDEELVPVDEDVFEKYYLNSQDRDFGIVGPGVFDKFHEQKIRPLEIAKIYFNFTDFPDKLVYNNHIEIKITDGDDNDYRLPYYLSNDNNRVTNKNEMLIIRIFNWTPVDQTFKIGLNLFHGLFVPVLDDLSDKVWVELYQSERQTRFTNHTHGAIIGEVLLDGKTLPYNSPDYGNDPNLWLDFVSVGDNINPTTKNLDKDAFDLTYW